MAKQLALESWILVLPTTLCVSRFSMPPKVMCSLQINLHYLTDQQQRFLSKRVFPGRYATRSTFPMLTAGPIRLYRCPPRSHALQCCKRPAQTCICSHRCPTGRKPAKQDSRVVIHRQESALRFLPFRVSPNSQIPHEATNGQGCEMDSRELLVTTMMMVARGRPRQSPPPHAPRLMLQCLTTCSHHPIP